MFRNFHVIAKELRLHAPFTAMGTLTGIIIMLVLLGANVPPDVSTRLFWVMHPTHVILSALVTVAMFRLHGGRGFWCTLGVGYLGSIGIATLSDCIIPFIAEWMLGLPNRGLHFGFIEKWWLVNPLALAGILFAVWRPHTRTPHSLHVMMSTWASLFHITMALGPHPSLPVMLTIAVFLFLAVWIPCCTSDIVFPLVFSGGACTRSAKIRPEVMPFLACSWILFAVAGGIAAMLKFSAGIVMGGATAGILLANSYFIYFFRDPDRTPPQDDDVVVSGADGVVASIVELDEAKYLNTRCVRISIFLSLFDVHVNRAPIKGRSSYLGYFPGKRLFTFQEKSSEVNQHNKILIEGSQTRCLICQIVGPVCRRVVYWPDHNQPVGIALGERIGMMKFGSRLDMYLPVRDIQVLAKPGDRVRAGETVVARLR